MNGSINMREGRYSIIPLFWVNATLATIIGLIISKVWVENFKVRYFNRYVCSVGKESIVYLCLNQIVIFILNGVFDHFTIPYVIKQPLLLIFSLIILYAICRIVFNSTFKIFFGR